MALGMCFGGLGHQFFLFLFSFGKEIVVGVGFAYVEPRDSTMRPWVVGFCCFSLRFQDSFVR